MTMLKVNEIHFSWRQILDLAKRRQMLEKAARRHFSLGFQGDRGIFLSFLFILITSSLVFYQTGGCL